MFEMTKRKRELFQTNISFIKSYEYIFLISQKYVVDLSTCIAVAIDRCVLLIKTIAFVARFLTEDAHFAYQLMHK